MKFDEHGHVIWTPRTFYALAEKAPDHLIDGFLMFGTPAAFQDYSSYCAFLADIEERIGVHPRNLYLRGSCQVGFSIAPNVNKVWHCFRPDSDLDLVIVDPAYFHRFEEEIREWEVRNPIEVLGATATDHYLLRLEDRQYNCCRDYALPQAVCVHHQKTMKRIADKKHCGGSRKLSAFIYPDWHSARRRYESDIRKLVKGVQKKWLIPPEEEPVSEKPAQNLQSPAGLPPNE
jgi:hypothetical protein